MESIQNRDLQANLQTILDGFPLGAQRPSDKMSTEVRRAFDAVRDRLQMQFSARASASYDIQHNVEFLTSRYKLPHFEFTPDSKTQNDRNPRLEVVAAFAQDMRGLFLLLTDTRSPDKGPPQETKVEQHGHVRALLGRDADTLSWQFNTESPRLLVGPEGDRRAEPFGSGVIYHRFYEAKQLADTSEILRDLDALLRLREIYVQKFQSTDLVKRRAEPAKNAPSTIGASRSAHTHDSGVAAESASRDGRVAGKVPDAKNLILYGPPGTGKTFSTARIAVELCGEIGADETVEYKELMRRYRRLRSEGRIGFVTFHQSYGYEEFIEGIRPVMSEQSTTESESLGGDLQYKYDMGVFKRIALLAASEGLALTGDDQKFEACWRTLQQRVEDADEYFGESQTAKYRIETVQNNLFRLVRVDKDTVEPTTYEVSKKSVKRWWNKRSELGTDFRKLGRYRVEEVLARPGGYTPNYVIYRLLIELKNVDPVQSARAVDLRQMSREKRRTDAANYLDERSGERAMDAFGGFASARPYVLIIDEINRGNISKILGELITLLEPSKRLTKDDELLVTLPYSKDTFGVPPNLHIIGTMNTADRSIALLDSALRRRFKYEEMMPDLAVIARVLTKKFDANEFKELDEEQLYLVNLVTALLKTLNERIEFLFDRDHQIGHTYFLEATSLEMLRRTFVDQVIPLLQEYFYGTWHQLALVLGCPRDYRGDPTRDGKQGDDGHAFNSDGGYVAPILDGEKLEEKKILRMNHEDYENQHRWNVHKAFADPMQIPDGQREEKLKMFFESILPGQRLKAVREGAFVKQFLE